MQRTNVSLSLSVGNRESSPPPPANEKTAEFRLGETVLLDVKDSMIHPEWVDGTIVAVHLIEEDETLWYVVLRLYVVSRTLTAVQKRPFLHVVCYTHTHTHVYIYFVSSFFDHFVSCSVHDVQQHTRFSIKIEMTCNTAKCHNHIHFLSKSV